MDRDEKLAVIAAVATLVAAIVGPFVVESYQRKVDLRNEAFALHNEISTFQARWLVVREQHDEHYTSTSPRVSFPQTPIYPTSVYIMFMEKIFSDFLQSYLRNWQPFMVMQLRQKATGRI